MLRDDISSLLSEAKCLINRKMELINIIKQSETEKRYLIPTDNSQQLLDLLQKDQDCMEQIELLDFDIQQIKHQIAAIAGMDQFSYDRLSPTHEIKEMHDAETRILSSMDSLSKSRQELIEMMERRLEGMNRDINSLSRLNKLKWDQNS